MRQKRLCGITVPVWADLRGRDGAVTNIRFRVAAHPDAEKLPSDAPERRLAAALEWHGWECYSRHVICRLLGCQPLLVASDDELMAILDVNPVDPRMSAWDRLAEREWDARLHESNHRTLMRHASRTAWLAARQAGQ